MVIRYRLSLILSLLVATAASATDPATFSSDLRAVTVDGIAVGSLWTPNSGGNALRNALAYDAATGRYHLWMVIGDSGDDQTAHEDMYNTSVLSLGTSPDNEAVLQQGPLLTTGGTGPGNFHVGAFGIIDDQIYLRVDTATGGLGRFDYTDAQPPEVEAWPGGSDEADLFSGTGQTSATAYAHNAGKMLRELDGGISAYYALRDASSGARLGQQFWRIRSDGFES
ncbi:MAG: hypothetical protein IPF83_04080 [Rhodanobacteraceae bacterium]|nr:hypothetical protein [Rhodanobacteraceae bacterium]MBK7043080.1 hypothetical protein [Rhodanobacteraceae bacterium]MBP9154158.1 hypothetical protein [Xanthomonadales bacterium]HQW82543.1 hypothetical protein [Pseudomonadota bacterium]